MKLVKVEWTDAWAPDITWVYPRDIKSNGDGGKVTCVGYLVKEQDDGIWLAMGYEPDGKVCNLFFIPGGMITELKDS